jgi:hypothetical protein
VASARGIPPPALPAHLASGAGCFLGHSTASGLACRGAPLLPLIYIVTNLSFNAAQLALLKATTAVVPSIALTLAGEGGQRQAALTRVALLPLMPIVLTFNTKAPA